MGRARPGARFMTDSTIFWQMPLPPPVQKRTFPLKMSFCAWPVSSLPRRPTRMARLEDVGRRDGLVERRHGRACGRDGTVGQQTVRRDGQASASPEPAKAEQPEDVPIDFATTASATLLARKRRVRCMASEGGGQSKSLSSAPFRLVAPAGALAAVLGGDLPRTRSASRHQMDRARELCRTLAMISSMWRPQPCSTVSA